MGAAIETISGYNTSATTTAGTYVAFTAQTGQSFTIRATPSAQAGWLCSPFVEGGAAGVLQIKSPRMHDFTIGTSFEFGIGTAANGLEPLGGFWYQEPCWQTDILTCQYTTNASQTGSTSTMFGMDVYYQNIPGISANLATWAQVQSYANASENLGDHYVSWVKPTTGGTAGLLGTGLAINNTNDQFKANHTYALLGYLAPVQVGLWVINGVDTGNLNIGGPGVLTPFVTSDYFIRRSIVQGIPAIPLIQANNKGSTLVSIADAQSTSTAFTVGLIWMDLGTLPNLLQ
jgi:hypothetical protein